MNPTALRSAESNLLPTDVLRASRLVCLMRGCLAHGLELAMAFFSGAVALDTAFAHGAGTAPVFACSAELSGQSCCHCATSSSVEMYDSIRAHIDRAA